MTDPNQQHVCPYCGNIQANEIQCESCKGLFEPLSRRATQIAMGPWFIKAAWMKFRPGCCFDVLKKMVAAGKVKGDSIVRGPTTHQIWQPLNRIPGLAHHFGFCHSCQQSVESNATSCSHCGSPFIIPTQRNLLGLSFESPAQLIARNRQATPDLCCICGEIGQSGTKCSSCGFIYEPAEQMTPISFGPWYIRDMIRPFNPGLSYEHIKRMIADKQISPGTMMRGPSSQQFWMQAVKIPGIANLLGHCHSCGTRVDAIATSCMMCSAPFGYNENPNELGLEYPTDALAAEAQIKLEAEVAQVTRGLQQPATPPPPPATSQPSQVVIQPGQPAAATPPPPPPTPEAPAYHPSSPFEDEVDPDIAAVSSRARRSGHSRRQNSQMAITLALAIPFAVMVVFAIAFIFSNKPDDSSNDNTNNTTAQRNTNNTSSPNNNTSSSNRPNNTNTQIKQPNPTMTVPAGLIDKRDRLKALWENVSTIERSAGFGNMLDQAKGEWENAMSAIKNQQYNQADILFDGFEKQLLAIQDKNATRAKTLAVRDQAISAKDYASKQIAAKYAGSIFTKGEIAAAEALRAYNEQKFEDAKTKWGEAKSHYDDAAKLAGKVKLALDARDAFDKKLNTGPISKTELNNADVARYKAIIDLANEGANSIKSEVYDVAVDKYNQASKGIDELTALVKSFKDAPYFAYMAGLKGYQSLIAFQLGEGFNDDSRNALVEHYKNLGFDQAFVDKLPASNSDDYDTLSKFIAQEVPAALAKKHSTSIKKAYAVGTNMVMVNMLLKSNEKTILPDKAKLAKNYTDRIEKEARAGGFADEFFKIIKNFNLEMTKVPDPTAVSNVRTIWSKLESQLKDYDTSQKLLPRGGPKKGSTLFNTN